MTRCTHPGRSCMPIIEQARYVDTLDVACGDCGATYTAGELHRCGDGEVVETWGPVKIGVVVVFAIAFIYAINIIAAAGQVPA